MVESCLSDLGKEIIWDFINKLQRFNSGAYASKVRLSSLKVLPGALRLKPVMICLY
ncbi:hypothetical protein SAMN04488027_11414 [Psychroflexus sediminis]|uniref:Uncharacterized protein n=1 Tax=Psychroflexus sediminis TaxID=470826 RepID=A0A1G7YSL2_9FLAO|nr:hypothetical protein SAMN04488027_11414 [Psychroflexus sediminis]